MIKKLFYTVHSISIIIALLICVDVAYSAMKYFGDEFYGRSFARISIVILCGSFSIIHAILLIKRKFSILYSLTFIPLFALLAIIVDIVVQGHFKEWAPSTIDQANTQSLIGLTFIALICLLCLITIKKIYTTKNDA